MNEETAGCNVSTRRNDALRLEELLDREVHRVGEDLRDKAVDEDRRRGSDLRRLSKEKQNGFGENVYYCEEDAGEREQHGGSLEINADHIVLSPSERLSTQRLHCTPHP